MTSQLLSALEFLSLRVKLGRVVYLTAREDCNEVLENHRVFATAYGGDSNGLGPEQAFFRGLTRERDQSLQSASEEGPDFAVLEQSDLSQRIPELVAGVVAETLKTHPDGIRWNELSHAVCREFLTEYVGVELSAPSEAACQHCFESIFDSENGAVGGNDKQREANQQSYDDLFSAVERSIKDSSAQGDTASSRVVDRVTAASLSQAEASKLLTAFLVGCYPLLQRALELGMSALNENSSLLGKVYQASFVGDLSAVQMLVRQLEPVREWSHVRFLTRRALEDHEIQRSWLPSLKVKQGDTIRVLINASAGDAEAMPAALRFDPARPAVDWLRFGVEPHLCFGAAIAETVLASVFVALFSRYRIESYQASSGQLELTKLPSDPQEYDFSILGSSPPWALAEEKRWLLESMGIRRTQQRNVMSLAEFPRLLIQKPTVFYRKPMFYVAYDSKHQVLLGSKYGGGGESAVRMGDGFEALASTLAGATRLRPLSDFSSEPDYEDYLKAYTDIREAYYTWAYFTAFLDGTFSFVRSALLVFKRRDGFRPLSVFGNSLLVVVLGLVALLLKLPYTSKRLSTFFRTKVETDQVTIQAGFDLLDRILSDGRPYIFGDTFSAADIQLCATLANMIVPAEFQGGGVMPPLDAYPPTYRSRVEKFRTSRTGEYVLRTYKDKRN